MKSHNIPLCRDLGLKTSSWVNLASKDLPRFKSRTLVSICTNKASFESEDKANEQKLSNFTIHLHLGVCDLLTHFGTLGTKRFTMLQFLNPCSDCHKKDFIVTPHYQVNPIK